MTKVDLLEYKYRVTKTLKIQLQKKSYNNQGDGSQSTCICRIKKKYTKKTQTQNKKKDQPKKQISCFIFIYSMVILQKSPHRYLKIPLKVQNNLVFNLVGSASRGIKLQLTISFSWSLLSHTEALQNYFGDWFLTVIKKAQKKCF